MLPLRFSKSSSSSFSLRHALPQSVQNTASTQFRLPLFASRYTSFVGRLSQKELLYWRRDLNEKLPRFTLGNKTGLGIEQFKAYELKGSLVSGCLLMSTSPSGCGHSCPYAVKLDAPNAMDGLKELSVINELENALGTPFNTGPQVAPSKPLVIVISGPSGVGKDAVIKKLQLLRKELHFVVTATTRPKRPGEVDGVDYYFITKNEFQGLIERNELLEHAVVYGDYKGIPKQQVREYMAKGMDVVLRVDVQGAATVRSILGSNAVFIFLVAESEFALVRRLTQRKTETLEKMVLRVSTAREELQRMKEFDYVVVNADKQLDNTVNTICSIIDAEKSRVQQRLAVI